MPAYSKPIRRGCMHATPFQCQKMALEEVYDMFNALYGRYCKAHAQMLVDMLNGVQAPSKKITRAPHQKTSRRDV